MSQDYLRKKQKTEMSQDSGLRALYHNSEIMNISESKFCLS